MATEVLAIGNTEASSADIAVTDELLIALKGATIYAGDAIVDVEAKDDAGAYHEIGRLTSKAPAAVISATGTYRVSRRAGTASVGVFSG